MPDRELELELLALGRALELPAGPDPARTAALVRRRLTGRQLTIPPRLDSTRRRLGYAAAALLVAFAVLLAGSPQVRAAVVEFFRFAGVVVRPSNSVPGTAPGAGSALPGAQAVADVAAAQALVRFPVGVPAELGPPDEVAVTEGRVVSLTYRAAGARLDQFDGRLDPVFAKGIGEPGEVRWVQLGDDFALWLPRPHEIAYLDRDGVRHVEAARLAGTTLLWQRAGVTYRLEGTFALDRALEIARSV